MMDLFYMIHGPIVFAVGGVAMTIMLMSRIPITSKMLFAACIFLTNFRFIATTLGSFMPGTGDEYFIKVHNTGLFAELIGVMILAVFAFTIVLHGRTAATARGNPGPQGIPPVRNPR